jgi:hypothetical protein
MPGTGPLRRSSAPARIKALVRKSRFRAAARRVVRPNRAVGWVNIRGFAITLSLSGASTHQAHTPSRLSAGHKLPNLPQDTFLDLILRLICRLELAFRNHQRMVSAFHYIKLVRCFHLLANIFQ